MGIKDKFKDAGARVFQEPQEGYTIPRKQLLPAQACELCGAAVPPSHQTKHTAWHQTLGR